MNIQNLTIASLGKSLQEKEFSAEEVTRAFLNNIKENDKSIGAYLAVFEKGAMEEAKLVDEAIKRNEALSPIAGAPIALKDNLVLEGTKTTAGSKILENYVASYDATIIRKLKTHKAVFLGKTNMDEFAMGSSTENSAFHTTKNPYDTSRVPGGSSGGSAAAVAGNCALAALGSDTGGSIRQPAALCGVVGLKPTYGAVSRFGLIDMASSLDQIGPITKTVEDAAILFDAIRGKDSYDATSVDREYDEDFLNLNFEKAKKLTVGVPKEYFAGGLSDEVKKGVESAMEKFKRIGIAFKEISLPHTKYALSCYYIIMPAEVSTNLARFDGVRYGRAKENIKTLKDVYIETRGIGFGTETKRRILLGTFVLSSGYYDAYYTKAQKVRRLIIDDFKKSFENGVDIIFTPVTPETAFKIGEKTIDPLSMYLSDVFTIPANLAGLPAISIPIKRYPLDRKELPVAFQLIGKHFHEPDILSLGMLYERE